MAAMSDCCCLRGPNAKSVDEAIMSSMRGPNANSVDEAMMSSMAKAKWQRACKRCNRSCPAVHCTFCWLA